jgi:hypothetical protein
MFTFSEVIRITSTKYSRSLKIGSLNFFYVLLLCVSCIGIVKYFELVDRSFKSHIPQFLSLLSVLVLIIFCIRYQKKRIKIYDPAKQVWFLFILVILLATLAFSELSLILTQLDFAHYEGAEPEKFGAFIVMYLYNFFDLVPVINVWKTLKLEDPLMPCDYLAGAPVLIFQLIIIFEIIHRYKQWRNAVKDWKNEKEKIIKTQIEIKKTIDPIII